MFLCLRAVDCGFVIVAMCIFICFCLGVLNDVAGYGCLDFGHLYSLVFLCVCVLCSLVILIVLLMVVFGLGLVVLWLVDVLGSFVFWICSVLGGLV